MNLVEINIFNYDCCNFILQSWENTEGCNFSIKAKSFEVFDYNFFPYLNFQIKFY